MTKVRMECPKQIEEDLACLQEDFLLNDKSKMLVLIWMVVDEMIHLVSMYPKVWFMDTIAGERMLFSMYEITLLYGCMDSHVNMNSY